MKDNILIFPDKIGELNCLRLQLALASLEDPDNELIATNHIVVGLHRFFDQLEGSEEILIQLGYLNYLIENFYDTD